MLRNKVPIKFIQCPSGIRWEMMRKLHLEIIENSLEGHMAELKASGYRLRLLAADEFVIRKGHSYAICVMDLETGEVLWVGEGWSKEDFERFFAETEPSFLSEVIAVATWMRPDTYRLRNTFRVQ